MKPKQIILFLIALLAYHFFRLGLDAGMLYKVRQTGMEQCHIRANIGGPEDLEYSKLWNGAIASAGEDGALYFLPNSGGHLRLTEKLPFPFHPHGISIFETSDTLVVAAVNHRAEESTIEIFSGKKPGELQFVKTIRDPAIITPNDLALTSANSFYFTNDHGSANHLLQSWEHFTRMGKGNLSFFNGKNVQVLLPNLFFANGVTLDKARELIYVALMLEKRIAVYHIKNPAELEFSHYLPLESAPDNLSLDGSGNLFIGAHPKVLTLKQHSEKHSTPSPTQIWRIRRPYLESSKPEKLFEDDGKIISASSVALPVGDHLLLGAIYDTKVMDCVMPKTD